MSDREYSKDKKKIIPPIDKKKRKPLPVDPNKVKELRKKAREAFKLLKKHYPKIGTVY